MTGYADLRASNQAMLSFFNPAWARPATADLARAQAERRVALEIAHERAWLCAAFSSAIDAYSRPPGEIDDPAQPEVHATVLDDKSFGNRAHPGTGRELDDPAVAEVEIDREACDGEPSEEDEDD